VNKKRDCLSPSNIGNIISWIKTWNNTDNYTIRVWMTMFCFLWTVQSNLFIFDVVCHLLNFSQNLLKFVHRLWTYTLMWQAVTTYYLRYCTINQSNNET
jgi:hypothetical protein